MEETRASDSIDSIFRLRESLIILGLTGRTGSGCSTVANILKKKRLEDLDLKSYKTCDFNNTDERKYSIIYRFMKEGSRWVPFYVIEASTIIFSFIAEKTFGEFYDFLDQISSRGSLNEIASIKKEVYESFKKTEKEEYNSEDNVQRDKKIFPEFIALGDFTESEEKSEQTYKSMEKAINLYCEELNEEKKKLKEALSGYRFIENVYQTGTKNGDEPDEKKVVKKKTHDLEIYK